MVPFGKPWLKVFYGKNQQFSFRRFFAGRSSGSFGFPSDLSQGKTLQRLLEASAPFRKGNGSRQKILGLQGFGDGFGGNLGGGNITGVADALQKGGAGVLFWMWVSALGAMVVKYAEVLLAMRTRRSFRGEIAGGAMFYIQPKIVALLFSLLGVLCAFSVGSGLQATAAGQAWSALFSFSPLPLCLFLSLLTAFCIFRKTSLLFFLTARLVPLMSGVYILLCLSVILRNAAGLPGVLRSVFQSAFTPSCALRGGRSLPSPHCASELSGGCSPTKQGAERHRSPMPAVTPPIPLHRRRSELWRWRWTLYCFVPSPALLFSWFPQTFPHRSVQCLLPLLRFSERPPTALFFLLFSFLPLPHCCVGPFIWKPSFVFSLPRKRLYRSLRLCFALFAAWRL